MVVVASVRRRIRRFAGRSCGRLRALGVSPARGALPSPAVGRLMLAHFILVQPRLRRPAWLCKARQSSGKAPSFIGEPCAGWLSPLEDRLISQESLVLSIEHLCKGCDPGGR